MKQGYFMENISDEKLAELIDEAIKFEKNNKTNKKIYNILKIIPAAAAVALVFGVINMLPMLSKNNGANTPGSETGVSGITAENESIDIAEEQGYYTYEEYIEFDKLQREFYKSQIDCTDENWLPMSGQPVLTQEIYDEHMKNWEEGLERALKEIQDGVKIPNSPINQKNIAFKYQSGESNS